MQWRIGGGGGGEGDRGDHPPPLNLSRYWKPMQSVRDRDRSPPLGMWMTSHGQCPRGGACECPRVGVFFNFSEGGWHHADNVQGGVLVNVFTPLQEILYPRLRWTPPPFSKILDPPLLGMAPCDLELLGGGPSAGIPFSFELKTFDCCNRGTLCSDWAILVKTIWWKVQYYKL